jgi:hypothetical protein
MLSIRLFLGLIGAILVVSMLGYALNRDPRWLRLAGLILKGGVALIALLILVLLLERLLLVV